MFDTLPSNVQPFQAWPWAQIAPYYADLAERPLSQSTLKAWLADWTQLSFLIYETGARLHLAHTQDTANAAAEAAFFRYLDEIRPSAAAAEQALKLKLLASGLSTDGLAVPLRNIKAEADLYREENLPLLVEESKLGSRYDKTIGAQTVEWEGNEVPLPQLRPILAGTDRDRRMAAWRKMADRRLVDRAALNDLWRELHALRQRVAANAGHPDYRSYMWQAKQRFDYSPADCATFHAAIETVCVPAATRIYERHRMRLGVSSLRPWDMTNGEFSRPADAPGTVPLKPYRDGGELLDKSAAIFDQVDPSLGGQYRTMIREGLLDAENRKGKAPGGYCTYFPVAKRPFIFMNAVGLHDDVQTMLHEAGHAFHAFASSDLPFAPQLESPMEFNEVASMAMELLAAPYLTADRGGFYDDGGAARARIEHLESTILFWPYMAVVDAFQQWAYTDPAGADPDACDETWRSLWRRFIPGVDFDGLDDVEATGWHRKLHIFTVPFYYVEYGLAQLGAAQVWRNSLNDHPQAVADYRSALRLGGTATLPQLFATAGANFAFDAGTLGEAVGLIERTVSELGAVA
ncbi:MAG: M3 family oligoendopeptidase [Ardenticatenales bacterium]